LAEAPLEFLTVHHVAINEYRTTGCAKPEWVQTPKIHKEPETACRLELFRSHADLSPGGDKTKATVIEQLDPSRREQPVHRCESKSHNANECHPSEEANVTTRTSDGLNGSKNYEYCSRNDEIAGHYRTK
jgi:hypothetical protein